jgi:uncharacterized protein (DUF2336 family)
VAKGLSQSADLQQFAESLPQSPQGMEQVFVAVSTLFERQNAQFSVTERALATDILKRISKDVEMSIRIALAEKLAPNPFAPPELVNLLADDRIEVARLVLAQSPVLTESDLLRIIQGTSDEHHMVVAGRHGIGEMVTAALARSDCEAVLITLLRNEGAKISHETFDTLVSRARTLESLQEPLAGRQDLPAQLATRMYVWVSGALKSALIGRYPHIAQSLARALDETSAGLQTGKPATSPDSAKKLIDKLSVSGQLKASFLIRVLQQGQMELFEQGFATLLKIDIEAMRHILYGDGPQRVALACRAAGIDKSVFHTVFHLSRHHRKLTAQVSDSDNRAIETIFRQVPKSEALDRLKPAAA